MTRDWSQKIYDRPCNIADGGDELPTGWYRGVYSGNNRIRPAIASEQTQLAGNSPWTIAYNNLHNLRGSSGRAMTMTDLPTQSRTQLADSLAATSFEPSDHRVFAASGGERDVSPSDTGNGSHDHHDAIADVLHLICDIEATSHLLTFAAVAVAEERGDDIINPPSVYLTRLRLTGDGRSHSAVKGSMDRLVEEGLVEKIDLEPDSDRGRFDWRLSDLGWTVLSVTGGCEMVRRFAQLDPADEDYDRQRARLRQAMQNIASLERTNHLCTLVVAAVLDRRGECPINGPAVIRAREECMQNDVPSESAVYGSLDRLEKEGLIEKTDWQPETNRTRMHVRVTEDGWAVLQATGTIGMVYDLLRDDD